MGRFIEITANNWVDDGQMVNIVTAPTHKFYENKVDISVILKLQLLVLQVNTKVKCCHESK